MLKRVLTLFFLVSASAWGQAQPPSMYDPKLISYNATPFGSCTIDQVALNTTNGAFSSCNPLTHTWVGALSNTLPLSLSGGGFTHSLTGTLTAPRTWTLQDASDTFVFRSTSDTLANKSFSTAPLPSSAGGVALGSAALPFSNLFFGPSASASFSFGGTPTAQRTITWPDASDTVVELGVSQTLTNKTLTNPVLTLFSTNGSAPTCSVTGAGTGATCGSFAPNSDDISGQFVISTGTSPASSGTATLSFNNTTGNGKMCVFNLSNGGVPGTWNARATVILNAAPSTSGSAANWDNNGVGLTGSSAYAIQYVCGRH